MKNPTLEPEKDQSDSLYQPPCVREWPCCNDSDSLYGANAVWEKQTPRRHGFHRPFHFFQITAITVITVLFVSYWAFVMPLVESPYHIVTSIVIGVLFFVATTSMVVSSFIDTRDYGYETLNAELGTHVWCFTCKAYVNRSSKHCKACNRCVKVFDHHCKWLNVCVGADNYKIFFLFVSSTLLGSACYLCLAIYLLIKSFDSGDSMSQRISVERPAMTLTGMKVVLIVLNFLCLVTMCLLAHLFGFHIMLMCRNLTTYDWILEQRDKERSRLDELERQQRSTSDAMRAHQTEMDERVPPRRGTNDPLPHSADSSWTDFPSQCELPQEQESEEPLSFNVPDALKD